MVRTHSAVSGSALPSQRAQGGAVLRHSLHPSSVPLFSANSASHFTPGRCEFFRLLTPPILAFLRASAVKSLPQAAGGMFWFTRKRFAGSYLAFTCWRRR